MTFRIPEGVAAQIPLAECTNCHSPTPEDELAEGICSDCQSVTQRAIALTHPPVEPEAFALATDTLPLQVDDELAARRQIRDAVKQAAVHAPQGWVQHAVEALRQECVQGRRGHEFTAETLLDTLERKRAPVPPADAASMRFIFEHGIARGWCEQATRSTPARRPEFGGRQLRVYKSLL